VPTATHARPDRSSTAKATAPEPSFAELVCLTLIIQGVAHGWALGTMLAPDGELGRIWTLSRPLTYRAIDGLAVSPVWWDDDRDRTTDDVPDSLTRFRDGNLR
jgi:hypothetical protein